MKMDEGFWNFLMFCRELILRLCSCIFVMMVLLGGTSVSFASKLHIKKPHISNPVKAVAKAEHSAANRVSHAEKSTVNTTKKAGKSAVTATKKAGKSAATNVKKAGKTVATNVKKAGKSAVTEAKKAGKAIEKGGELVAKGLEKEVMAVVKKLLSNTKFLEKLLNPALKSAKLPTFEDMKTTAKCISPTLKDLKTLLKIKNPLDPKIDSTLEKIKNGKCREELEILADDCKGPGVLAVTMTPAGGAVAGICGKVSAVNSRINTTITQVELAQKKAKNAEKMLKGEKSTDDDDAGDDDEH